jgi:hypothetical protein
MTNRSVRIVFSCALPALLATAGCMPTVDSDPKSPEFAALCSSAYNVFYVDGGKGPAYVANSKRQLYWRDRYYRLTGISDEAAKKIIKIGHHLAESHRGESSENRNASMRKIMDVCARHEA